MKYLYSEDIATLIRVHAAKNRITMSQQAVLFSISNAQLSLIKAGKAVLGESKNGLEICKILGVEYVGLGRYKRSK